MAKFVQAEIGWINLDHVVQIDRETDHRYPHGVKYVLWLSNGKERWCRDLQPYDEEEMAIREAQDAIRREKSA